ncbi:MAG: efflux RND transporter periplasmic adaptor subunit [Anaerolineaceae bacterium]
MKNKNNFFGSIFTGLKSSIAAHRGRWIIGTVVVVAVVVVAIVFAKPSSTKTTYQTAVLKKGNIANAVSATGSVRAAKTATLQWQTSGEVGTVDVAVGDKVTKDEELATLLQSSLPDKVILAQSDLVTAQQNLANVQNSYTATANAQLALANAKDALDTAKKNVVSTSMVIGDSDQIDQASAEIVLFQETLNTAQDNYNVYVKNHTNDADPTIVANLLNALAKAKQKYASASGNLNYEQSHYTASDVAISQANLAVAQAKYDDAERAWELAKNGPSQSDIAAAQAQVDSAQALLNEAHLTAPFDGTVTKVSVAVGDQVSTGTTAIRIDDLSNYLIDLSVSEMDINSVQVGQKATITFDAITGKTYNGTVTSVSKAGESTQNSTYFTVTLQVNDADSQVLPGMTATADIIETEVNNVVLIPNRAVRTVDGKQTVYIERNGQPVAETVTLGTSSGTYSALVSGNVKESDVIILNPSSISSLSTGTLQ